MSTTTKLTRGIYKRGDVFWLNIQRDGKRRFISLDTSDTVEAIIRASNLRDHRFPDEATHTCGVLRNTSRRKSG